MLVSTRDRAVPVERELRETEPSTPLRRRRVRRTWLRGEHTAQPSEKIRLASGQSIISHLGITVLSNWVGRDKFIRPRNLCAW